MAGGQAIYVGGRCHQVSRGRRTSIAEDRRGLRPTRRDGQQRRCLPQRARRLHEFSEEDLDFCFDVNAKGTFFGAQEAVKQFLAQGDGGNIINLVSTAGLQGHPNQSVYNISKGAQANLTRCLAIEYGQDKIRVNGICPTYAKTSLTRALFDDKDFDQVFTDSIPLKRWGEVDDIANLADVPRLRRVHLHPRGSDQGRRRGDPLPVLGLIGTSPAGARHPRRRGAGACCCAGRHLPERTRSALARRRHHAR
jgi:hypothetical protein